MLTSGLDSYGGSNVSITRSDGNKQQTTLNTNNQNIGSSKKSNTISGSDKPIATSMAEELRKQYPKKG